MAAPAPAAPAALAVLVDAALLLVYLLGWIVALGLLYTWNATFHHLFKGIADALTFTIGVGFGPHKTVHLGGWANSIDKAAQGFFSDWALGSQILVGKFWHALAYILKEWSHAISRSMSATLDLGHWIVHTWAPTWVEGLLSPLRRKTNTAAAAAGAAGALAALLKKTQRAEHAAEQAATDATRAAARAAGREAHQAKSVATTVENTVVHETKVITQVVDVWSLPKPFGRTIRNIRARLGTVEALLGATAFAAAMANVIGIPSWRCLTKGPLGRTSRALCGLPSRLFEDLLAALADLWVLENVCVLIPFLEKGAEEIGAPLVEALTVAGAGICKGSIGAPATLKVSRVYPPPLAANAPGL